MLLVNVKRSYPDVAERITSAHVIHPEGDEPSLDLTDEDWQALKSIACGWWQYLSIRYLDAWASDYLAATANSLIVGIFRVDGYRHVDAHGEPVQGLPGRESRVLFDLSPAPEAAHLIGQAMPGGPWQRGEGRGTRGVATPADLLPKDAVTHQDVDVYLQRTAAVAVRFTEGTLSASQDEVIPAYTSLDTSYTEFTEIGEAQVRLYPDGTIGVTAPAGLRVVVSSTP